MTHRLNAPPGPLTWLHEELLAREGHRYGVAQHAAWRTVLAPPDTSAILDSSPLARSAAAVLRQAGCTVVLEPRAEGLEVELARAAERSLGEEIALDGQREGAAPLWVLPLPSDAKLGAVLDALLHRVAAPSDPLRERRPIPFFATADRVLRPAVEDERQPRAKLASSWWGLLPGNCYEEDERQRFHALLRALHPRRLCAFQALENAALCGEDLYARELARTLGCVERGVAALPRFATRALIVGLEGIDGSGKSSHVAALAEHLRTRGLGVGVHKIYRHGLFHATVTDLARQCATGHHLQLWSLEREIKLFDSLKYFHARIVPDLERCDVLLFDRYLPTHYAAGRGRTHVDPHAQEMLSIFPRADLLFWLDLPIEDSLARLGSRGERTIDENPYMLSRYRAAFRNLTEGERLHVLDSTASFDENQRRLRGAVDLALEERSLRGDA